MSQTQYESNKGLAQMLKGGVIMDVTTPEQPAKIAEADRCMSAVMALQRRDSLQISRTIRRCIKNERSQND